MRTNLTLTSTAFEDGGMIPLKYTCDGDSNLSPPLVIAETELVGRYSRK